MKRVFRRHEIRDEIYRRRVKMSFFLLESCASATPTGLKNVATPTVVLCIGTLRYIKLLLQLQNLALRVACSSNSGASLPPVNILVPWCGVFKTPMEVASSKTRLSAVTFSARWSWTVSFRWYLAMTDGTVAHSPPVVRPVGFDIVKGLL